MADNVEYDQPRAVLSTQTGGAGAAPFSRVALLLGAGEEAAEVGLAVALGDVC